MRIISSPPTVPGLADAIALLTALETVEKQKELLGQFQDYLKRAEEAKADFDKAKEEAEAVIKEASQTSVEASEKWSAAADYEAKTEQKAAELNADRKAFQTERNKTLAELEDWEKRNATIEAALKAREERLASAEKVCIDRKAEADALVAEFTAKLENLKKIAA